MSVLAVCIPRIATGMPTATVAQLHENFWSYRRRGRRRYALDLGLQVEMPANGRPLDTIHVFVPFKVASSQDVTKNLRDQATAQLVFNNTCSITPQGPLTALKVGTERTYLLGDATVEVKHAKDGWSELKIQLQTDVPPGGSRYVRIRCELKSPHSVVYDLTHGMTSTLTSFDVRICEKRQWARDPELVNSIGALTVIPVAVCQYFLIVPAAGLLVEHSPALKYTRLLEPKEWESYLGRPVEQSSVYYWKHDATQETKGPKEIGPDNPFRVYAKFRIGNPVVQLFATWLPAAAIMAIALALLFTSGTARSIWTFIAGLWATAADNPGLALGLTLIGAILGWFSLWPPKWLRKLTKRRKD